MRDGAGAFTPPGGPRTLHALRRLARHNLIGVLGGLVVVALCVVALFAAQLSPFDPNAQIGKRLTPPGEPYVLGLDQLGRDVFSRLVFGTRVALGVGVTAVGVALLAGASLGVFAG